MVQCFFGLHLVNGDKPVAIVESEKTAILCSEYIPLFTWLAAGALNGLNEGKMRPLKGLDVILFPDQGAYNKWKQIAEQLQSDYDIIVSDLFHRKNLKSEAGMDLADILEKENLKIFLKMSA